MTSRLPLIAAWLATGHALVFGLFWLLLRVPESNALMLAASAVVVLALITLAGLVEGGGLIAWQQPDASLGSIVRQSPRALFPFAVGLVFFAAIWWLTGWAEDRWFAHRGEIDAWLMLRTGWSRTASLHTAFAWLMAFVRWTVGLSLVFTIVAWSLTHTPASLPRFRWLREALSPVRLAAISAVLWLFLWLPWQAVYWRPKWLDFNWQEPVFVVTKLAVIYMLATLGWALVLAVVTWRRRSGPAEAGAPAS